MHEFLASHLPIKRRKKGVTPIEICLRVARVLPWRLS